MGIASMEITYETTSSDLFLEVYFVSLAATFDTISCHPLKYFHVINTVTLQNNFIFPLHVCLLLYMHFGVWGVVVVACLFVLKTKFFYLTVLVVLECAL